MTKKELRKIYQEKRMQLSDKERNIWDDLLLIQFQQLRLDGIQTLFSYWPLAAKKEPDTHLVTDYMAFRIPGLRLAFPVSDFTTHTMQVMAINEETVFESNPYGIAEPVNGVALLPSEIDAVFVPLLIFDTNGYRVGYGKGFYDKFLASCAEDVVKIGFSYFDPVDAIDDINEFDVPLNLCITPNQLYEF